MDEYCKPVQRINLHCFKGKEITIRTWKSKFQNTYFGVTDAAQPFDQKQLDGLRAIASNKLLLKTDAPYFPLGKAKVSTPACLGDVAAKEAVHVDMRGCRCVDTVYICISSSGAVFSYMGRSL